MLHQTLPILGQLWQLFEVSQILEFLRYSSSLHGLFIFSVSSGCGIYIHTINFANSENESLYFRLEQSLKACTS